MLTKAVAFIVLTMFALATVSVPSRKSSDGYPPPSVAENTPNDQSGYPAPAMDASATPTATMTMVVTVVTPATSVPVATCLSLVALGQLTAQELQALDPSTEICH